MLTIDHEDGTARTDLQQRWDDPAPPHPQLQEDELICSTESVPPPPPPFPSCMQPFLRSPRTRANTACQWPREWSRASLCKQGLSAHVRLLFDEEMQRHCHGQRQRGCASDWHTGTALPSNTQVDARAPVANAVTVLAAVFVHWRAV